jgi:DNA-binding beta-propeller fold protein YncE
VLLLGVIAGIGISCSSPGGRLTGMPGCSTVEGSGPFGAAQLAVSTGGSPAGVVAAPDGQFGVVAVNLPTPNRLSGPALLETVRVSPRPPAVVRAAVVPSTALIGAASLGGAVLSSDGRLVVVADGDGAIVADLAVTEAGSSAAVLGVLRAPATGRRTVASGTVEVAVSPDDRYVATSDEDSATVTIYDFGAARASGFSSSPVVAHIAVNPAPSGVSFSPDGKWLFVLSQATTSDQNGALPVPGTLTVIDAVSAETGSTRVIRAVVPAGCDPVRIALSHDGATAWVTDRGANALVAFDVNRLLHDPRRAFEGWVRVGSEPVGVALTRGDSVVIVADSNRFVSPAQPSTVTAVDAASVLSGHARLLATLPVGGFPRDVATLSDDRTVLVTDFGTGEVSIVTSPGV